jgi:type I restriction enzyme, S subunit
MKVDTFFKNFELLTDAPNAVVKLREIVLQLAVEGRLLSQNPEDEPTLLLLERIQATKKRLIEEKKIPKSKNLLPPSLNEFPYKLAENWHWVRLGEICTKIVDGSHNPPPDQGTGIPMISSQNVLNNEINFSASRYISQEEFEKEMGRTPIRPGDVFLTIVGSIGRSSVVPQNIPKFAIQRSIALIRAEIYPYYLSLFFRSSVAQGYFNQQGKGTAQKGIYLEKLSLLPIAVPPLAEQKRIVEKCDRLMSLCDTLEANTVQIRRKVV